MKYCLYACLLLDVSHNTAILFATNKGVCFVCVCVCGGGGCELSIADPLLLYVIRKLMLLVLNMLVEDEKKIKIHDGWISPG